MAKTGNERAQKCHEKKLNQGLYKVTDYAPVEDKPRVKKYLANLVKKYLKEKS